MANTTPKTSTLRILVLAPSTTSAQSQPPSPFPSFLKRLTGSQPSPIDLSSFAGYTSHAPLHLKTKYYDANVSIWCDELSNSNKADPHTSASQSSESTASLLEWQDQMTSDTAREVRDAIGAVVLILPYNSNQTSSAFTTLIGNWTAYIETVSTLRDMIEDETAREIASLVVLQDFGTKTTDEPADENNALLDKLEDECLSTHGILGWDFVSVHTHNGNPPSTETTTRNEYGERTGFDRIIEVLQTVDWSADVSNDSDQDILDTQGMDTTLSFLDDLNLSSLGRDAFPNTKTQQQQISENLHSGTKTQQQQNSQNPQTSRTEMTLDTNEMESEIMELKMAMLEVDNNDNNNDNDQDDFGTFASAELPEEQSNRNDDDAWKVLDDREGEELQVDQLQGLMERVVAIREAGSEMNRGDREKFAKREVGRLMRQL